MNFDTPIRLDSSNIHECIRLAESQHWPAEVMTWSLLFNIGNVYGVRDDAGTLVGVVGVVRYDRNLATIGGLLVAPGYEGLGLGSFLTRFAIASVRPIGRIWLTATDQAKSLYSHLDFVEVGQCVRYAGYFDNSISKLNKCRDVRCADIEDIVNFDKKLTGSDRSSLISAIFSIAEISAILHDSERVMAYGMVWRSAGELVIGPVVGDDAASLLRMLDHLKSRIHGNVRIEIDLKNRLAVDWAIRSGLVACSSTAIMINETLSPIFRHSSLTIPATRALS